MASGGAQSYQNNLGDSANDPLSPPSTSSNDANFNNINNMNNNNYDEQQQQQQQQMSPSPNQNFIPPNNNQYFKEPNIFDILFRREWNVEFVSTRGLARHMFGGYFLGFCLQLGISLFIIAYYFNDYYQNNNNNNNNITLLTAMVPFSIYIIMSSIAYTLEYTWHAMFHPETLDFEAFIIYTHSTAFHIALFAAFVEYYIEYLIFPSIKVFGYIHFIGLLICIFGQFFRSSAQFTAGIHFTHLIATEKRSYHRLIKNGVYSISRHPSYFGWFWWSVGTQILLCNPICTLAYAVVSWNFFNERIPFEEAYLLRFFGQEYVEYKRQTPILIPFMDQH